MTEETAPALAAGMGKLAVTKLPESVIIAQQKAKRQAGGTRDIQMSYRLQSFNITTKGLQISYRAVTNAQQSTVIPRATNDCPIHGF